MKNNELEFKFKKDQNTWNVRGMDQAVKKVSFLQRKRTAKR